MLRCKYIFGSENSIFVISGIAGVSYDSIIVMEFANKLEVMDTLIDDSPLLPILQVKDESEPHILTSQLEKTAT